MKEYLILATLAILLTHPVGTHADELDRERDAFHLGLEESPANITQLVNLIKDPKETLPVKLEAVSSLMLMESPTAFSALVTTLKDRRHQPSEVRALAAAALGGSGDPNAIYPLLETLEDEKELVVQWKILKALGAIGNDRCLKVVETYCASHYPILLKKTSLHVLAEHKRDGVFEKLIASLYETDDLDFKTSIVISLAELDDPRAEAPLMELYSDTKVPERQSCCLSKEPPSPELKLKIAILDTLGQFKSEEELYNES